LAEFALRWLGYFARLIRCTHANPDFWPGIAQANCHPVHNWHLSDRSIIYISAVSTKINNFPGIPVIPQLYVVAGNYSAVNNYIIVVRSTDPNHRF
jgi:hypothetical protein